MATDTISQTPPTGLETTALAGARKAMVESQLRPSNVADPVVIGAMAVTPREDFVPENRRTLAYTDRPVPIAAGRFLNPPLATGLLLDKADIRRDDTVLVIAAGTGYTARLLAPLVEHVVALEEDAALADQATANLQAYDNAMVRTGPLVQGWAKNEAGETAEGEYSLIVIDGAIETLPDAIGDQLRDGGRIVTGLNEGGVARLASARKAAGRLALIAFADSEIVPLAAFAAPKTYQF